MVFQVTKDKHDNFNFCLYFAVRDPLMVAQWLRYCAKYRKVAGSISDGVIGVFH
jgi:hypothetical protein